MNDATDDLWQGIYTYDLAQVQQAVLDGADIEDKRPTQLYINKMSNYIDGSTPLIIAAVDDPVITKFLISQGAKVNEKDSKGNNALHWAMYHNCLDVVKMLVTKDSKLIFMTNKCGKYPLFTGIRKNALESIKYLLTFENVVLLREKTKTCYTPLHEAAFRSNIKIVKLLLDGGAKVNAYAKLGILPIHAALLGENSDSITLFLRYSTTTINTENMFTKENIFTYALRHCTKPESLQVLLTCPQINLTCGLRGPLEILKARKQKNLACLLLNYMKLLRLLSNNYCMEVHVALREIKKDERLSCIEVIITPKKIFIMPEIARLIASYCLLENQKLL